MILRFFKKGPLGPFEASEAFDYEIKIYSVAKVVRIVCLFVCLFVKTARQVLIMNRKAPSVGRSII